MENRIGIMQKILQQMLKSRMEPEHLKGLRGYPDGSACAAIMPMLIRAKDANPRGSIDSLTDCKTGADMDCIDKYPKVQILFDEFKGQSLIPIDLSLDNLIKLTEIAGLLGEVNDERTPCISIELLGNKIIFKAQTARTWIELKTLELTQLQGDSCLLFFSAELLRLGLQSLKRLTPAKTEPKISFELSGKGGFNQILRISNEPAQAEMLISQIRRGVNE